MKPIFISEVDRDRAFRTALYTTAKFHQIRDCDYKSNHELYHEIVLSDSPLLAAINRYFEAYDDWFHFYQVRKEIEQTKQIIYQFSPQEKRQHGELVKARQEALDDLQSQYDQLRKA